MVFPLCFHVVQVLGLENTEYNQKMVNVHLVPVFGESFMRFFPILLLFFISLKIFEIYDKLLILFGLRIELSGKSISDDERIKRAKVILENAIFDLDDQSSKR